MIVKGLKFNMVNSGNMEGEVVAVHHDGKRVDIKLTPSDGNAFQVTYPIEHARQNLENKLWKVKDKKEDNYFDLIGQ